MTRRREPKGAEMNGTSLAGASHPTVGAGILAPRGPVVRGILGRILPAVATTMLIVAGFAWLVAAVGVVPVVAGVGIGAMVLSVLVAWSLVKV
jgi:hypothetical protein